jgi:hypothetical protein
MFSKLYANGKISMRYLISKYACINMEFIRICTSSSYSSSSSSFNWLPWQATDVPQRSWLIVLPALDVPTLATRCLRAYRRFPHSRSGSWNLWAGKERGFCLDAIFHGTSRDRLHAANLATWDPRLHFPSEGRRAEDFSTLKNPKASSGFEPANLGNLYLKIS